MGYVTYAILHPSFGFIRQLRDAMNLPYYDFYTDPTWWPLILTLTSMWKGMNGYLIYAVAGIFGGDFGLFYTIPRNVGLLYETTDIINTYVFRGLQSGSFLQSSAIGLMQSVIGCLLLVGTNAIVRKVSPENSLF